MVEQEGQKDEGEAKPMGKEVDGLMLENGTESEDPGTGLEPGGGEEVAVQEEEEGRVSKDPMQTALTASFLKTWHFCMLCKCKYS